MAYDATNLEDMDETLPLEGAGGTKISDLNNVDRETRLCIKNTFGAEHDKATGKHNFAVYFHKTKTISAAAAGTAINFLENTDIPTGKKIYLSGFFLKNNGAAWAGTGALIIQDNETTPVKFVTIPVADLVANVSLYSFKSTGDGLVTPMTEEDAFIYGTGGTLEKGIQIKAGSNGTGGDVICTVYGIIQ
jgi:hypothetical protein